jgi:transcriptional regulator GlxA family with amidase domain
MSPKDAQRGLRISPFIDRLARKATMVANAREGYATSTHAHDCDMLFVPLAGRFDIVDAQGDALQSSPGHFLWFAAGAAHATSAQTLRQTHLAVYVDSEFWEMALRAQGVHAPAQGMRAGSAALTALSQQMLSLAQAGEAEERVIAHCGALIMEAARLTAHPLVQPNDRGAPAQVLAALLADDIEADLARPLSLDAFAQRHRLSRRQVERIFKSAFGASPLEFQQRKRLERARHLLETTDDSVLSVAQQVGWESGSYLTRMLGKAWATTAMQIRACAPPRHH